MNKIQIFLKEWYNKIPYDASKKEPFRDKVDDFFNQYTNSLESIPVKEWDEFFNTMEPKSFTHEKYRNRIKLLHKKLLGILDNYLNGLPVEAYKDFEKLILSIKTPNNIENYLNCFDFDINSISNLLYRVREIGIDEQKGMSSASMFHIPYSKRWLVSNQRYSINGHPILYLGRSIDVCLKELNLQSDENVFVSKFEYQNKLPIILLDLRIPNLNSDVKDEELLKLLFTFPLIAICSFRVKYTNASFKEEYIFPQLMLQSIRSEKIKDIVNYDGIIYTSTKISADERAKLTDGEFDNIAIPSHGYKYLEKIDYCKKLCQQFKVSEPIPLKFKTEIEKSVLDKLVSSKTEIIKPCENVDLNKIGIPVKNKN